MSVRVFHPNQRPGSVKIWRVRCDVLRAVYYSLVLFTYQRVYENIWLLRDLTPEMDEIFAEHKYLSYRKPHGVRTCNLISRAPCRCYFVASKPVMCLYQCQWCCIAVDSFALRFNTNYITLLNVFVGNKVKYLLLSVKLFIRGVYMCAPVILCGVLSELLYWRLVCLTRICSKTKCSCNQLAFESVCFTKLRYCKIYTTYFTSIQSIFCIHSLQSYTHLYTIYMPIVKTVYIVYSRLYTQYTQYTCL